MQAQRVPAWKRLGLKLKYANESSEAAINAQSTVNGQSDSSLNKSDLGGTHAPLNGEPSPKRRRVDLRATSDSIGDASPNHAAQDGPRLFSSLSTKSRPTRLKKRVSFTADTKLVDGDTSLGVFSTDLADYQDLIDAADQGTASSPSKSQIQTSPPEQAVKPKKPKKPKSQRSASDNPPSKINDSLTYLDNFYYSPSTWKFNKNREIWILKHILSTTDIPPSYNLPLVHYIHGLKSQGARARLAVDCREALERSPPPSSLSLDEHHRETEEAARQQLLGALGSDPATRSTSDKDHGRKDYQDWVKKQSRPEILLWSLNPSSSAVLVAGAAEFPSRNGTLDKGTPPSNGISAPKIKKRKNRTAVVEYSSSSSSSDQDSSSESERDATDTSSAASSSSESESDVSD